MFAAWLAVHVGIVVISWISSRLVNGHLMGVREVGLKRHPSFLDLLAGWDGRWYERIALHGYPAHVPAGHQSAVAFFPLIPIAVAALHLTGLSTVLSALVVGNVVSLGALVAAAALTEQLFDSDVAGRTAIYLAVSPVAFVLAMPYSEGAAMACGFGAVALASGRRPWLALPLALLAGLARPSGCFFAVPLAALMLRRRARWPVLVPVALAPIAGLGLYAAYLRLHTGDALAFAHVQATWGRRLPGVHGAELGLVHLLRQLVHVPSIWSLRDAAVAAVALLLLLEGARRRLPVEWLVFSALCVVVPLASGSTQSLARFSLLAIPLFWTLALLGRRSWFDQGYRAVATMLLAAGVLTLPLHWP